MKTGNQVTRRRFIQMLGHGAVTSVALKMDAFSYERQSFKHKPNILMILVDDLGYGDLSCQGRLT